MASKSNAIFHLIKEMQALQDLGHAMDLLQQFGTDHPVFKECLLLHADQKAHVDSLRNSLEEAIDD